jgi:hypothetical protein
MKRILAEAGISPDTLAPPPPVARQSFLIFPSPLTSTDTRTATCGCFDFLRCI